VQCFACGEHAFILCPEATYNESIQANTRIVSCREPASFLSHPSRLIIHNHARIRRHVTYAALLRKAR